VYAVHLKVSTLLPHPEGRRKGRLADFIWRRKYDVKNKQGKER
jgi:hypothetical protein